MTNEPIDLDKHRGMAALIATDVRRQRLYEFRLEQAALRRRQDELEKLLLAAPAKTWPEAGVKAQYLIQLFAATPKAQDPRYKRLIAHTLEDLDRLSGGAKDPS